MSGALNGPKPGVPQRRFPIPSGNGAAEPEASAPSGSVLRCTVCGEESPAGRKFCGQCGRPLYEPCPACGVPAAIGERFCGACGTNLIGGVEERVRSLRAALEKAKLLRAEFRFAEAVELLKPFGEAHHPRLRDLAEEGTRLAEQMGEEHRTLQMAAIQAFERAQQRAGEYDFPGAIRELAAIPAPVRGEPMREFLARIEQTHAEVERICQEVRQAGRDQSLEDLSARLNRLLKLNPRHPHALQWAERLAGRLEEVARRTAANGQYEKAVEMLQSVPEHVRTDATNQFHRRVSEIAWLWWDLKHAPIASPALKAAGSRLVQLIPDDSEAAALLQKLEHRIARADGNPWPEWEAPPATTPLGCPVDWLRDLARIEFDPNGNRDAWNEHPGAFFIACGLALQGIGQGAVPINLLPSDAGSVLNRMTRAVRKLSSRTAWGLDLGVRGLKGVKLSLHGVEGRERVVLEQCVYVEHRKLLSHAINEIEQGSIIRETIRRFFAQGGTSAGGRVCVGVPGTHTLGRLVHLPAAKSNQLAKALPFEAQYQFPLPLDCLAWGYHALPEGPNGTGESQSFLLVASVRDKLLRRIDLFCDAGVNVDVVQSDCLALGNFHAFDRGVSAQPESDPGAVLLLDVGSETSNVVVVSSGRIWFRTFHLGAETLNAQLVRRFGIGLADAERIHRDPVSLPETGAVYDVMSGVFDEWVQELRMSMAAFGRDHTDVPISRIWGLGGGFLLHGLFRHLRNGR